MTAIRSALIVGGGIAGPVTAMALRRAGIEATVYEAYPVESNGIGGGLGLAPNGLAALEIVGAADAVRALATPLPNTQMSLDGKVAGTMTTLDGVEPLHLVMRGDLHRVLHDTAVAAGVKFVHGKRLVGAQEHADSVTAQFADGTSATADVLIGADGIRSRVRTLIDADAPGPNYTGMLGFGVYDIDPADVPGLDVAPGTMVFAFGERAYYLYWRGQDGRISWGANLPWKEYLTIDQARAVPGEEWLGILRETFRGDVPGEQLARATTPETLETTGALHIMPPVPHWHRGRMVLVGDAVHAPSNSTGQGASLAIESAVQLARCLRDLPDHAKAFAAYEQLRRRRVEKIAAAGARINHAKAPGPVAKVFMRAVMPIMFHPKLVEKTSGTAQRYRVDFDERVLPATAS